MDDSLTAETEELMTCLWVQFYHPFQASRGLYQFLPLEQRLRQSAEDPIRFGRDAQSCAFVLADPRVSRRQMALQAYRHAHRDNGLLFSVQNLSQKGHVTVNGASLGYLERAELPDVALLRFGEYEVVVRREPGDAQASFEVLFEVLSAPPSQEMGETTPTTTPVADSCVEMIPLGSASSVYRVPQETDESIYLS